MTTPKLTITERIRLILDREGIANKDAASFLGMTNSRLSQKFKAEIWDSVDELRKISEKTGYTLDWIITGNGPEKEGQHILHTLGVNPTDYVIKKSAPMVIEEHAPDISKSIEYLKGSVIRPITVVVDRDQKELISYVPIKAQAGYQKGFADSHFMEKLPSFSLPALAKDATYRMFQVDGNSMMQLGGKGLKDGDIVIAQYVDDVITGMRDNRVYVVVSPDGVVIKRCINRLKLVEDPILILTSDNKSGEYPNIILRPKQIKEVWEAKKVISSDFSFDTNLFDVLGDLQAQTEILKERMNKLEKK